MIYMMIGLVLVVLVALGAHLYQVLKSDEDDFPDEVP